MADRKRTWTSFKNQMKAKRLKNTGKNINKTGKHNILDRKELVVQRLSAEVSGKAQKYTRVGPREFVTYQDGELTVEGIKEACVRHFALEDMSCDILASDQGPSCTSMEHIPDLKVIHVRFINETSKLKKGEKSCNHPPIHVSSVPSMLVSDRGNHENEIPYSSTRTSYPKSLSVSQMIKLGKTLKPDAAGKVLDIYSFNLETMTWDCIPQKVEFIIEDDVLGSGGFRTAYKATSSYSGYNHTTWVVKKYLDHVKKEIKEDLRLSMEEHTKKIVQMHALAKNIASQLTKKVKEEGLTTQYGETLKFKDVFFAKVDEECVTLEEFIEGDFVKYINNTGKACVPDIDIIGQKAQCLAHFSYEKSKSELMILDIQGSGHMLFDPEIATADLIKDKEVLFCAGNLTEIAINEFISHHSCNEFCRLIGLKALES
jgi:hypothetical protein